MSSFDRVFSNTPLLFKLQHLLPVKERPLVLRTCKSYSKLSKHPEVWSCGTYRIHYRGNNRLSQSLPNGVHDCTLYVDFPLSPQNVSTVYNSTNQLVKRTHRPTTTTRSFTIIKYAAHHSHDAIHLLDINQDQSLILDITNQGSLEYYFQRLSLDSIYNRGPGYGPEILTIYNTDIAINGFIWEHLISDYVTSKVNSLPGVKVFIINILHTPQFSLQQFLNILHVLVPNVIHLYIFLTLDTYGCVKQDNTTRHVFYIPKWSNLKSFRLQAKNYLLTHDKTNPNNNNNIPDNCITIIDRTAFDEGYHPDCQFNYDVQSAFKHHHKYCGSDVIVYDKDNNLYD